MTRAVTALLWLALLLSGTLVAARAILGPFQFPISVRSPLNAESICGISLLLLLGLRSANTAPDQASSFSRSDVAICGGIAALIAIAYARAAGWYFLSDDFILLQYAAQPVHHLRATFTTAGGDGFYRPLVYASFAWTRFALNPALWHAFGIGLHLLNTLLLFALALELRFSRFVAGVAAALFAVHATRPEVVIWVTGRFDLLATFFVLLTLICFLRQREARKAAAWKAAALLAMILGFLCKESAYSAPVALLVILIARGDWRSRRWLAYVPFFAAALAVFAWRFSLLHGIGGYLTAQGTPQALSLNPVSVSKALFLRLWAILYFPINWSLQPGLISGIATAIYVAALAMLGAARSNRRWMLLSLGLLAAFVAPVIPVMLIGADLEKARYLYLPSVAFCMLLAIAIDAARARWAIFAAVALFQLAALWHNLIPWESAASMSRSACELLAQEPPSLRVAVLGVPGYQDGVQVFANGLKECVDVKNPNHAALLITLNDPTPPPRQAFDRAYSWDEKLRALKRIE